MTPQEIIKTLKRLHKNEYWLTSNEQKDALELGYVTVSDWDCTQMKSQKDFKAFLKTVSYDVSDKGLFINL